MKKLVLITGVILISCVLISALASPAATAEIQTSAEQTTREEGYVIKDYDGRIAVFRADEQKPFMVTETYTNTLPKSDREKLLRGLEAESKGALRKMLEDYCS